MTENQDGEAFEEIPKPRLWYILQFISLLLMALIGGGLFAILALNTSEFLFGIDGYEALGNVPEFSNRKALYAVRYIQVFSSIGTFVFASVAQLVFMREPLVEAMGLRQKINPTTALLAVVLVILMQPAISFLANWCLTWQFPASMAETETLLREAHNVAVNTQFAFLKDQSGFDFLFNLFMMALLPAFAEELFFRRVGMRLLFDITRSPHISIALSALFFALAHGQFYYLLPLFLFGIVLGYLALWSRSLWLPVLAHFINNATALSIAYFSGNESQDPGQLDPDFGYPVMSFIFSVLLSLLILVLLKRREETE